MNFCEFCCRHRGISYQRPFPCQINAESTKISTDWLTKLDAVGWVARKCGLGVSPSRATFVRRSMKPKIYKGWRLVSFQWPFPTLFHFEIFVSQPASTGDRSKDNYSIVLDSSKIEHEKIIKGRFLCPIGKTNCLKNLGSNWFCWIHYLWFFRSWQVQF